MKEHFCEVQALKLIGWASRCCMFAQDFFIKNTFPFQATIVDWNDKDKVRVRVSA